MPTCMLGSRYVALLHRFLDGATNRFLPGKAGPRRLFHVIIRPYRYISLRYGWALAVLNLLLPLR